MKPLPTDLEILNAIYDLYYNDFAFHADKRSLKAVVKVDVPLIAESLGVDVDIIFGRLYYHLDPKYRYTARSVGLEYEDAAEIRLFLPRSDFGVDGVHFPFLSSVLAQMREDESRRQTQPKIAWISLAVSAMAVAISFLALIFN